MARIGKLLGLVVAVSFLWALARPAPRLPSPLPLGPPTASRISDVEDAYGRRVLRDLRVVEDNVFIVGVPLTATQGAGDTAFEFLRRRSVALVVSLTPDQQRFYEEEGYLRYWEQKTGHHIAALWLPVLSDRIYMNNDRSALHAAAELVVRFKREWPAPSAVYLSGGSEIGGRDAREIVVAAYELWRNRGWVDEDTLWSDVESRFMREASTSEPPPGIASRLDAFRALRQRLHVIGEL